MSVAASWAIWLGLLAFSVAVAWLFTRRLP